MKRLLPSLLAAVALLFGAVSFAQEQVTINVAVGAVGTELELHRQAMQQFMDENPNVTVEVFETPEGGDRLGLYLQYFEAQSSEVDVLQLDVIWPGAIEEHLVDLYQYGAREVADQHFPATIQNGEVDGRLVAIPYQIGAGLLYYRTDLLEEYGYDGPPETWEELEEMATTIQQGERDAGNPDMWGYVFQGNSYEGLTCNALEWVASSNGGTVISPEGEITIYNDNAVDIITRAAGWVGSISPSGVTGFQEGESANAFMAGNSVFLRNWPYVWGAGNEEGSAIAGDFGVSPLPSSEDGEPASCLGGQMFGVSQYSDNPEIAAQVALHLASPEVQKLRAVEGSFSGTVASVYEDPEVLEANPFFAELTEILGTTVPRPSTVTGEDYNAVSREFYQAVHDVLTGREDAENALALLELELESITGFPTGNP